MCVSLDREVAYQEAGSGPVERASERSMEARRGETRRDKATRSDGSWLANHLSVSDDGKLDRWAGMDRS